MIRLPLKLAVVAVAAAALGIVAVVLLSTTSLWMFVLVPIVAGLGVFTATRLLVSRRLIRTRAIVDSIADVNAVSQGDAGDEIDHLNQHLDTASLAVREKVNELNRIESYRKDFLGDISHELKTPIFAVRGFAETLIDGAAEDPDVRVEFLEKIIHNADRLGTLAEDLNAITRIETGELRMEKSAFQILDVLTEVAEQLEPIAKSGGVNLTYRCEADISDVFGDRYRINQVIRNLAENAIKYSQTGGRAEMIARKLGTARVRISVADNGIGIPADHIDRITERFYRVDRSRSRGLGGTGLGLAIVKHILAAHDQALNVESTPGKGSTFAFDLPVAEVQ